jgi:hypothetical protein
MFTNAANLSAVRYFQFFRVQFVTNIEGRENEPPDKDEGGRWRRYRRQKRTETGINDPVLEF